MSRHTLTDVFEAQLDRVLSDCLACGKCARRCPAVAEAMPGADPAEIQRQLHDFVENPSGNELARARAMSCRQCFGCLEVCPQGINPMLVQLAVRAKFLDMGLAEPPSGLPPNHPESEHRKVLAERLTPEERRRILDPSTKRQAKYVLFPGCNVYLKPELLLTMQKVMDKITDDWAFLPGMATCCGNWRLDYGKVEEAEAAYRRLLARVVYYKPETLVLWCPTCLCNIKTYYNDVVEPPFAVTSFFQLLAERMGELDLAPVNEHVTLHEPCKTAFTGLDTSHRQVLAQIPGLTLTDMPRHGEQTVCCGSSAPDRPEDMVSTHLSERLAEAKATGAESLAAACHYCQVLMDRIESPLPVQNVLDLAARCLGVAAEETGEAAVAGEAGK